MENKKVAVTKAAKLAGIKEIEVHKGTYHDECKVYIQIATEGLLENLVSRHSRPYNEWKRNLIPHVLRTLGLRASTKARWSQSCGCKMCPCSPGFTLVVKEGNREFTPSGRNGTTVYVTI